ncbi:uncharacterized protein BXZ73DRAFT_100850 [Epithele typhae]|nr:uncharacterized protein BXZ73DRAFT_100850 [Epithele typhae]KAH9934011.1 hypothetical protein BXZ73DRAFT_100850 [Epithele typhae]
MQFKAITTLFALAAVMGMAVAVPILPAAARDAEPAVEFNTEELIWLQAD